MGITIYRPTTQAEQRSPVVGMVLAIALTSVPASTLATDKVYSPHVEKGELALEARGHLTIDDDNGEDGAQGQIYELEYGVTDYWKTAILGELEKGPSGSLIYTATGWENIFSILHEEKHRLDGGLYLEYKNGHGSNVSDEVELKLLLEKRINRFVNTVNLNFEKEVDSKTSEDVEFEYGLRSMTAINPDLYIGLEAFGEIGEVTNVAALDQQEHRIGPIVYGKIDLGGLGEMKYNIGWLFGLTGVSADGTFKWELEYEFPF